MQEVLIGEILNQMGKLTRDDIEQIVQHQRATRQKFGQIAVRWGLITQEHVWEAWARQLAQRHQLDLESVGSDTAAWRRVPPPTARKWGVVPLRLWGEHLVLAAPADISRKILEEIRDATGCQIHVCISQREAIERHLDLTAAAPAA